MDWRAAPMSTDPTSGIDATTSTVYVDPHTRLFHRADRHAGADALAFSRPQAAVFGYRPCPDCFDAHLGGGST